MEIYIYILYGNPQSLIWKFYWTLELNIGILQGNVWVFTLSEENKKTINNFKLV